jgi:hypothetical protein
VKRDGILLECLRGHYAPRRLRFTGLTLLKRAGLYATIDQLPPDHPARCLLGILHWYPPGKSEPFYVLLNASSQPSDLLLSAAKCLAERRSGAETAVTITRPWTSPPSLRAGLVPSPQHLLRRYGGNPVSIRIGERVYHQRLFVGGLDHQPDTRPEVDVVLNLGETPSRWNTSGNLPQDRWLIKGEGGQGMGLDELVAEARWAIRRLQAGERLLVHCVAGFNRSVTLCCAILILLEKLSAEVALQRVREHHRWAMPDGYHWLALRWLAQQSADDITTIHPENSSTQPIL